MSAASVCRILFVVGAGGEAVDFVKIVRFELVVDAAVNFVLYVLVGEIEKWWRRADSIASLSMLGFSLVGKDIGFHRKGEGR